MSWVLWVFALCLACLVDARGLLIAVESFDRESGKYFANSIFEFFRSKMSTDHYMIHYEFTDKDTDIGSCIDGYCFSRSHCNERAKHLLYSANRWDYQQTIENYLNRGTHILVDNYYYVQMAESLSKGLSMDFCVSANVGLPKPDLVFFWDWNRRDFDQQRAFIEHLLGSSSMQTYEPSETDKTIAKKLKRSLKKSFKNVCAEPIKRIE